MAFWLVTFFASGGGACNIFEKIYENLVYKFTTIVNQWHTGESVTLNYCRVCQKLSYYVVLWPIKTVRFSNAYHTTGQRITMLVCDGLSNVIRSYRGTVRFTLFITFYLQMSLALANFIHVVFCCRRTPFTDVNMCQKPWVNHDLILAILGFYRTLLLNDIAVFVACTSRSSFTCVFILCYVRVGWKMILSNQSF